MLTVLDAIKLSSDYMEKKGVESPRLNSELFLSNILNCKRLELYLNFERPLTTAETDTLRSYISRRGKFEPLQYILGSVEFYGLEFAVNPSVLIPRQETEILIDTVIVKLGKEFAGSILDIGTGSGIIPVTLAVKLPNATFTALDISEDAIKTAKLNAEQNAVSDKICFINDDIFNKKLDFNNKFEAIISNPPYISVEDAQTLQKELLEYEPRTAYCDNSDGYTFYKEIISRAKDYLLPKGKLVFEAGEGQFIKIEEMMKANGFCNVEAIKDYLNIERVIYGELI
ncbi:MAG: peptide chain release factor N(5)-glutamine methyltransferase [Bacteroidota bacterium]|nr:peptide chain release factor N(5)-glutamine methyltransferase [Bacteroidota bacterium]